MTKRGYGNGSIASRNKGVHRLRYIIGNKRFSTVFRGTLTDARKQLRALVRTGDTGEHIAPDTITVEQWIDRWLALLERASAAPAEDTEASTVKRKRRRGVVAYRSVETYSDRLRLHIVPTLGDTKLQKLLVTDVDKLYLALEDAGFAVRSIHSIHTTLRACLQSAVNKKLLRRNPTDGATVVSPDDDENEVGTALEPEQLRALLNGMKASTLYPIVMVAASTGMRRNELLGLRWGDLNVAEKTLRIERSIEHTTKHGLVFKAPKRASHKRSIALDNDLVELLVAEHARLQRLVAGVPADSTIDLSLVKLPADALIFPNPTTLSDTASLARPRLPRTVARRMKHELAEAGFPELRPFHDFRVTHETMLLDKGVPVHVVAKRCGQSPAVLLKFYAKMTRKADQGAASVIGTLMRDVLQG